MKLNFVLILLIFFVQEEKVTVDVISKTKEIKRYSLRFERATFTGLNTENIKSKIDSVFNANKIDCPSNWEKMSSTTWRCGNGNKIRTRDNILIVALNQIWNDTTN